MWIIFEMFFLESLGVEVIFCRFRVGLSGGCIVGLVVSLNLEYL